jgi:hypothetical protein
MWCYGMCVSVLIPAVWCSVLPGCQHGIASLYVHVLSLVLCCVCLLCAIFPCPVLCPGLLASVFAGPWRAPWYLHPQHSRLRQAWQAMLQGRRPRVWFRHHLRELPAPWFSLLHSRQHLLKMPRCPSHKRAEGRLSVIDAAL